MKNKVVIFLLIAAILAVGYISFRKVSGIAGKKMIEQIVKEADIEAVPVPSETVSGENTTVGENKNENENKEETVTENNSAEPGSGLPSNIMDHPYVKSIYGRFSAGEIAEVSAMMSGGFTAEEKSRAKQIILSKVSRAEINKLKEIYNMYYQ